MAVKERIMDPKLKKLYESMPKLTEKQGLLLLEKQLVGLLDIRYVLYNQGFTGNKSTEYVRGQLESMKEIIDALDVLMIRCNVKYEEKCDRSHTSALAENSGLP